MLEVVGGYPADVVALCWHDMRSPNDVRSGLTIAERDNVACKHDVRILAKSLPFAKDAHRISAAEDLHPGAGQWHELGRVAVVTDDRFAQFATQFFGPFFHGAIRVFPNAKSWQARAWLDGHDVKV